MKIKTSEATGLQLDWDVAAVQAADHVWIDRGDVCARFGFVEYEPYSHTDPAVCLALMSKHELDVTWGTSGKAFVQMSGSDDDEWHGGKTLAEAVARCVISMKLGDEFEVPSELGVMG